MRGMREEEKIRAVDPACPGMIKWSARTQRLAFESMCRRGREIPWHNLLGYVAVVDRPNMAVMDLGGVLLCHDEELNRWEEPGSSY